jgi:ubiquinone/menaquinone biosynthesis C-methylase UbiE
MAVSHWDHSNNERFFNYYAEASHNPQTFARFRSARECVLRVMEAHVSAVAPLEVADIGCGAGTQSILWAELGHHVHAVDVSERLLALARKRATEAGYSIDFQLGSAVKLPWPDTSMDVCLAPELLEHVADWRACLAEFTRILKPGGILYLATTNKLCPVQHEFNLLLYSWYPRAVKRYLERLAATTHPRLANFATFPAVNWFTFYGLRKDLAARGFRCLDRFDVTDFPRKPLVTRLIVRAIRAVSLIRWLAHVATPGSIVVGVKDRHGCHDDSLTSTGQ